MYDPEQFVHTKWSTHYKAYYENLGYEYTGINTDLDVKIKHLPLNSNVRVPVQCDICHCDTITPFRNYNRITNKNGLYRCKDCTFTYAMEERDKQSKVREFNDFLKACEEHNCKPVTTFEEFHGYDTDMCYICPKHGFTSTMMHRIVQGAWCYECGKEQMGEKAKLSKEKVIQMVESKNNNKLLNPEDYISEKTRNLLINYGCCNEDKITSLASLNNSDGRCADCARKIAGKFNRTTEEEFIQKSMVNGKIMIPDVSEFKRVDIPMHFLCAECGKPFLQRPLYYFRGYNRCKDCYQSQSTFEFDVKTWLIKMNINYYSQYTFPDCKNIRLLPFDFYLPDYNTCIEADGEQHFRQIDYFGGEEGFKKRQKLDEIKNNYCETNDITLIRIPYWERYNIDEFLSTNLNIQKKR